MLALLRPGNPFARPRVACHMTAELRWFWTRLNANYWFYPASFSVLAAGLAALCIHLDRSGLAESMNDAGWFIPARPESASNMLQVIASSMISVASTVFAITITAVVYASGSYGPRLLTNFMEDRGNQLSLATFIGTFVYALWVLRTVRAEDESPSAVEGVATTLPGFVPQISLLVAYTLMAISVAVLVFFLNHIPSGIRINTVLKGIGQRLVEAIEDTYPDRTGGDEPAERPRGPPVLAHGIGYVQFIEFDDLAEIADRRSCRLVLQVRTGDFVHRGMALLEMCEGIDPRNQAPTREDDGAAAGAETLAEEIRNCFTLGASRTPSQDAEFLMDELVEIGLRALSPGINDPFTAITSLHWLGAATAEIGQRRLHKDICSDEREDCPVIPLKDDFHHYLNRGFGAIRSAVATSPIAANVMLETLKNAADTIDDPERRALLLGEGRALVEQARLALNGPDLAEVEQHFGSFVEAFRTMDPRAKPIVGQAAK